MGHKTVVKIDKTKEPLEVLGRGQQRMVANGINMRGEGSDASGSDHVTEKRERRLSKGALGQIDQETIGFEDVKAGSEMGEVKGEVRTGHQDVIQIETKGRSQRR